jgi:hypothetical protein
MAFSGALKTAMREKQPSGATTNYDKQLTAAHDAFRHLKKREFVYYPCFLLMKSQPCFKDDFGNAYERSTTIPKNKATNAINFANRANKRVNEKIAAGGEEEMKGPKDSDDTRSMMSAASRPSTRGLASRNANSS